MGSYSTSSEQMVSIIAKVCGITFLIGVLVNIMERFSKYNHQQPIQVIEKCINKNPTTRITVGNMTFDYRIIDYLILEFLW